MLGLLLISTSFIPKSKWQILIMSATEILGTRPQISFYKLQELS